MTSIIVWCTLPSTPVEHQRDLELLTVQKLNINPK